MKFRYGAIDFDLNWARLMLLGSSLVEKFYVQLVLNQCIELR
ncbi:hypothetical protein SynROS8604_00093 [Synechococcus sp. ROS8604]|nr:hypothetical protein SynROS8604_00093 [Synechococcus sp. ROS8604]